MTTPDDTTSPDASRAPAGSRPRAVFAAAPSTILAGTTPAARKPAETTPAVPTPREDPAPPRRHAGSGAARGVPRGWGAVVTVVTLAIAVAVVLAVVVVGLSNRTGGDASAATAGAVEQAATTGTQAALSYDYRHLDSDFTAAEKLMTPGFAANYKKTTATSVQTLATKYHAVSTATVEAAGVGSVSSSQATVLVFVDQTVRNSQLSAPRLDRSRVEVSLVHSGGRWLVANLSPI